MSLRRSLAIGLSTLICAAMVAAPAAEARGKVYFRNFAGGSYSKPHYRPHNIQFGKRSGIFEVQWSRWNGSVARGRGKLLFNNCQPSCAQARARVYLVSISLSQIRNCGGRRDYTRFSFRFLGARPAGYSRTYSERHTC